MALTLKRVILVVIYLGLNPLLFSGVYFQKSVLRMAAKELQSLAAEPLALVGSGFHFPFPPFEFSQGLFILRC